MSTCTDPLPVDQLYNDHHRWLQQWLQRRLGNRFDAEDLAHDAFMRLLDSREAIAAIDEPRAFLTTIAKRLLMDRSRRFAMEQAYREQLALAAAQQAPYHPSPEATAMAIEALSQIAAALEGLASAPREAFLRHYLDEQPQAQIAQTMGVTKRMVQKYLAQALVHCRLRCATMAENGL